MAIIGIDLGTSNTLASVFQDGRPILIPNRLGGFTTPSVVGLDEHGSILIGKPAKERMVNHFGESAASLSPCSGTLPGDSGPVAGRSGIFGGRRI